ncbi:hypothetical protein L1987_45723 [Smallanthus sonchifolius]|uniref:Uncharacterized protein n=1 Tax=Smallanthus sonchifolius TaxID=185202 RepID=A0ACB9FYD8_9ASTR|nr:hypothetical protein L1987_45723 [Smallanthus sonchifolius]
MYGHINQVHVPQVIEQPDVQVQEIVDPVFPEQHVLDDANDNIQDALFDDLVIPESPREGVVEEDGVDILNKLFSQATTTSTQVGISQSTPTVPIDTSTQVTPGTQILLNELINTPPVDTTSGPSVSIPVSTPHVSPILSQRTTRSASASRAEAEDHASMVHTISPTASLDKALKQLAAQRESSCRQEMVVIHDDKDDDDSEGAQDLIVLMILPMK